MTKAAKSHVISVFFFIFRKLQPPGGKKNCAKYLTHVNIYAILLVA
jgi:hypothetical protein